MSPCIFIELFARLSPEKKITVFNLNPHRLVGFLSEQRRISGQDCLQRGKPQEADAFMRSIQKEYDADRSLFFRHQAFFHLYWGLGNLALQKGWKAFQARPFYLKNFFSLLLIVFRIAGFLFSRALNKKSYNKLLTRF